MDRLSKRQVIARSNVVVVTCAVAILIAGGWTGSSSATTTSVRPASHTVVPVAATAQHVDVAKRVHWHIHIHRHVDYGVPHTDMAHAPHFDTPEAAMRYLAAAWNAKDVADLKHVTDPAGRAQLQSVRHEAVRLALDHCEKIDVGKYNCILTHEYPNAKTQREEEGAGNGIGHMYVEVGPADGPGWYMTVFQGCGG